jgi:hypothetical protein
MAVACAGANFLAILIQALDGSDAAVRRDKLAAATRRPARKAHRLRKLAARHATFRRPQ